MKRCALLLSCLVAVISCSPNILEDSNEEPEIDFSENYTLTNIAIDNTTAVGDNTTIVLELEERR